MAVSRGLRPTTLVRRVQPDSEWDDLDFDLLSAMDRAERDRSEKTGLPWWLTRTGHPQVAFVVETTEDAAEAALDKYDEDEGKKKKRKHGVHRYARPQGIDDFPVEGGLARDALLEYAEQQNDGATDDDLGDLVDRKRPEGGYNPQDYG